MELPGQEFTRGVGVYPGDPKEDFSPALIVVMPCQNALARCGECSPGSPKAEEELLDVRRYDKVNASHEPSSYEQEVLGSYTFCDRVSPDDLPSREREHACAVCILRREQCQR